MERSSLNDVFIEQLKILAGAETQIVKALPKLANAASTRELREAFDEHVLETREHVDRLNHILSLIGATAKRNSSTGIEGLLAEVKETLQEKNIATPASFDAAIIAVAQRVERYEIAAYRSVCANAKQLGLTEALGFLQQTLSEEEAADKKLGQIATQVHLSATASTATGT